MVEIRFEDDKFLIRGTVKWGFAGECVNKDFTDDGAISTEITVDEILDAGHHVYMTDKLRQMVEAEFEGMDEEKAAEVLEKYFNSVIEELDQCQTQLTNYFLYQLISFFWDTGFPFWETEQAIVEGYGDVDESVYTKELSNDINAASENLNDITNFHGTMTIKDYKADVRAIFEKHLPMFNLDGLEKAIDETSCTLSLGGINLQFSDNWGKEFFCYAYERFARDLAPIDWHNF